jgi:hypothetical protein
MFSKNIFLCSVVTVITSQAWAAPAVYQSKNLKTFMKEFHQNPEKVMDQLPPKTENYKAKVFQSVIKSKDFIKAKNLYKGKICKSSGNGIELCANQVSGRASIEDNDQADQLVDKGTRHLKTLTGMDNNELTSGKLSVRPWSDDYWAIAKGVLGARYADPNKSDSLDWKENRNYVEENPVAKYLGEDLIGDLSPSEKYDILMGDKNYTLTKKMWDEGRSYYDRSGEVEPWMGICHGWAPAAYMLDRPTNKITVTAVDGITKVPFYPSDIKSLASLLWANVRTPSKFIGGRCNEKDPKKENGRVTDQKCFDTNPGTWHKVVVNQIGISDRSFVMDATFDYEVWNQPVYAYSYEYFNPMTFDQGESWKDYRIKIEDYTNDKFKKFRTNPETKYIVGVVMQVQYIAETHPTHAVVDSEDRDMVSKVHYRYDLELNARGKILGGEWYTNAHPDFLWTPAPKVRALTSFDRALIKAEEDYGDQVTWDKGEAVPTLWGENLGRFGISRQGKPLALVVEGLIERSSKAK